MKKLKGFFSKASVTALCTLATVATNAEVVNPLQAVATEATEYIDKGKSTVVDILAAGLVIVAAFFIWRLIKKGISAAK